MPFPPSKRKRPPSLFFLNLAVAVIAAYFVARWLLSLAGI